MVSISERVSAAGGTTTESGGCGDSPTGQDEGFSYMTVVLDLDDGTYGVDLSGTVTACSRVSMQVAGQDVSYDADDAAFTVTPDVQASLPQIPRDGLYLNLSSPALVAAGQGLPLVGVGRLLVQLGRVPDSWYKASKRRPTMTRRKRRSPRKRKGTRA